MIFRSLIRNRSNLKILLIVNNHYMDTLKKSIRTTHIKNFTDFDNLNDAYIPRIEYEDIMEHDPNFEIYYDLSKYANNYKLR